MTDNRIADLEATIRNLAAVIAKKDEALITALSLIEKFSLHVINGSDCMRIYDAANLTADGVELVEVGYVDQFGNYEHNVEPDQWTQGDSVYTIKQKG